MTAPSLKALAEAKTPGITKLTDYSVDPDLVQIEEGWNGRDEGDDLAAYRQRLKAAMKAGAFIPAIDVQMVDGVPMVRDGHSRVLMARELKAEGVPYVLQARQIRGNDTEMRYHMIGTAAGRSLTPLELGRQFLTLTRQGETVAQIAARLGQHRSTVENGLQLAEMPAAVQKQVAAGQVASHTALKTVKAHGKQAATVLAAAIADAATKGKKKATGKNLTPSPLKGRKTGFAVPPAETVARAVAAAPISDSPVALKLLAQRVAAINILNSKLDRDQIVEIVQSARMLTQGGK